jgi:hypothetical protein
MSIAAPVELARHCNGCNQDKPVSEFYANPARRSGYEHFCKLCWNARTTAYKKANRQRMNAARRESRKRQTLRGSKWALEDMLRARYGITVADLDALTAKQEGLCALCGEPPKFGKRLHIDHSHETGRVRGLLCLQCNAGLGQLRDDPALLRRAIAYLEHE